MKTDWRNGPMSVGRRTSGVGDPRGGSHQSKCPSCKSQQFEKKNRNNFSSTYPLTGSQSGNYPLRKGKLHFDNERSNKQN